jgi:hypothetical protein
MRLFWQIIGALLYFTSCGLPKMPEKSKDIVVEETNKQEEYTEFITVIANKVQVITDHESFSNLYGSLVDFISFIKNEDNQNDQESSENTDTFSDFIFKVVDLSRCSKIGSSLICSLNRQSVYATSHGSYFPFISLKLRFTSTSISLLNSEELPMFSIAVKEDNEFDLNFNFNRLSQLNITSTIRGIMTGSLVVNEENLEISFRALLPLLYNETVLTTQSGNTSGEMLKLNVSSSQAIISNLDFKIFGEENLSQIARLNYNLFSVITQNTISWNRSTKSLTFTANAQANFELDILPLAITNSNQVTTLMVKDNDPEYYRLEVMSGAITFNDDEFQEEDIIDLEDYLLLLK